MPRRLAMASAVVGGALVMAACSTPTTDAPATSSSTLTTATAGSITTTSATQGSTSPTSTQPSNIPEAARAQTPEAAEEFTKFFLVQANKAYQQFDASLIDSLFTPDCAACKNIVDSITDWKSKGYHYSGDYVSATYVTVSAFNNDGTSKVFVTSRTDESKLLDSKNATIKTFPAETSNASVFLKYQNGSWVVTELKQAA